MLRQGLLCHGIATLLRVVQFMSVMMLSVRESDTMLGDDDLKPPAPKSVRPGIQSSNRCDKTVMLGDHKLD